MYAVIYPYRTRSTNSLQYQCMSSNGSRVSAHRTMMCCQNVTYEAATKPVWVSEHFHPSIPALYQSLYFRLASSSCTCQSDHLFLSILHSHHLSPSVPHSFVTIFTSRRYCDLLAGMTAWRFTTYSTTNRH